MTGIHDSLTVIDGLVISKWNRAVFVDMRKGGLTTANCTCSIWEGFAGTMRNIAQWKRWFADSANLITPVRLTADISRAKAEGKTGEDQVGYVRRPRNRASFPVSSRPGGRSGVDRLRTNQRQLSGPSCLYPDCPRARPRMLKATAPRSCSR